MKLLVHPIIAQFQAAYSEADKELNDLLVDQWVIIQTANFKGRRAKIKRVQLYGNDMLIQVMIQRKNNKGEYIPDKFLDSSEYFKLQWVEFEDE